LAESGSAGDRVDPAPTPEAASRSASGLRLGGFIYGTIVALAVIVEGRRAFPHGPGHVAVLVGVTTTVLWLAHVYAHGLAEAAARATRLRPAELRRLARNEVSMVEAALPLVVALLLASIGVLSAQAAYRLALACGLVVLGAQGLRYARVEALGTVQTVGVVVASAGLGVVLVGLELLVLH
jgi:hypothetical protein